MFLAVSVVGLFWVFGTEVAAIVLGLAALLIGICFLPVSWGARAGCLAVLAAVLACVRSQIAHPPGAGHGLAGPRNDVHVSASHLPV